MWHFLESTVFLVVFLLIVGVFAYTILFTPIGYWVLVMLIVIGVFALISRGKV